MENNMVTVVGKLASDFWHSHEICGEKYYRAEVEVPRLSGRVDILPLVVSEKILDLAADCRGREMEFCGQLRSRNRHDGMRNHLELSIFVREMGEGGAFSGDPAINRIALDGYICKPPTYRTTPLGREITDLLVAVNRPCGKSDYIPCITWGQNARKAASLAAGDRICARGRVQSREYTKKLSETEGEMRVAYEVSLLSFEDGPSVQKVNGQV